MGRNAMSNKERKIESISVRCSPKEKAMIERKAKAKGKSISAYMTDCSMAGLERRSDKERKNTKVMIENQEILNNLIEYIESNKEELDIERIQEIVKELIQGEFKLWES